MGWVGQTRDGPGPALGQAGSQALGFKGPQIKWAKPVRMKPPFVQNKPSTTTM